MEINIILQAAFILSKAVWKPMIDANGGSIVYLSSGSGYRGLYRRSRLQPGQARHRRFDEMPGAGRGANSISP